MKAWFVWVNMEWGDFVHAKTAGKAKSEFLKHWGSEVKDFRSLAAFRIDTFDDIPFTKEALKFFVATDDGVWDAPIICTCEMCKKVKE